MIVAAKASHIPSPTPDLAWHVLHLSRSRFAACEIFKTIFKPEAVMRSIVLYLLGVPVTVIVLIALVTGSC